MAIFQTSPAPHQGSLTPTYSFIGKLAGVEPLRSRSVLNIMDGLNGVWHGGPFSSVPEYRFSPKQIFFGTDPVAMDRLPIDVIEAKRKQENAVSIWDRAKEHVQSDVDVTKPNFNHFAREPGHIEMASNMGLGEYDKAKSSGWTLVCSTDRAPNRAEDYRKHTCGEAGTLFRARGIG